MAKEKFLEYKGKPLVRSGNTVYYGDMNDPYVVCLNIKDADELKDIKLAKSVTVQLLSTDESLPPLQRIIKKSEKAGLFIALDLGATWLERQLKKDSQQYLCSGLQLRSLFLLYFFGCCVIIIV